MDYPIHIDISMEFSILYLQPGNHQVSISFQWNI